MSKYPKLSEPFALAHLQLKNRIVFAPTGMGQSGPWGEVTDQNLCHYVARAQGGAGLIVVEHTLVTYDYSKGSLGLHNNLGLRGWWEISHAVHHYGAKAVVQLGLGHGGQISRARRSDIVLVAPSDVAVRLPKGNAAVGFKEWEEITWEAPRPLTAEEIVKLEDAVAEAALRAQKAGFDGVELHGAHGYILSSFLSPYSNRRTDAYGGSFERRLTLARNAIRKTRAAVGKDFVIGLRLSAQEHVDGGYGLDEGCEMARALEGEGLNYIHASSGRFESLRYMLPREEGAILSEAAAIKKAVGIPVICPNFHTPQPAETALEEGLVDAVSLSRGLIADPDWPSKALGGREEEITACVRCNSCLKGVFGGFGARCAVNPDVGRERFIARYAPPPLGFK